MKVTRVAATSGASASGGSQSGHPPVDETVVECSEQQKNPENSSSDQPECGTVDDVNAVEECGNCLALKETNRQLLNRVKTLTGALAKWREECKNELRKHSRKGITEFRLKKLSGFIQNTRKRT